MPTSSSSTIRQSKSITRRPKPSSAETTTSNGQDGTMKKQRDPTKMVTSNGPVLVKRVVKYRECRKNHAARVGGYAIDGCLEFMASGEEGTAAALICAACDCHRSFHNREVEREVLRDCSSNSTSPRWTQNRVFCRFNDLRALLYFLMNSFLSEFGLQIKVSNCYYYVTEKFDDVMGGFDWGLEGDWIAKFRVEVSLNSTIAVTVSL